MTPTECYTVLDIETWTPTGKVNSYTDELRYVGFKAYNGDKRVYHSSDTKHIQEIIDYFPYLVGHNIIGYDKPVLERHGFKFYGKTIVDTLQIAENRCKSMMYLDLNKGELSLSSLAQRFCKTAFKGEYDYKKLEATILEGEDLLELVGYLEGDLDATDELFKYFYSFFYGFREFMSDRDKEKLRWLLSKPGGTAYKCICHMAGLKEEYADDVVGANKAYAGGFVSEPYLDKVER